MNESIKIDRATANLSFKNIEITSDGTPDGTSIKLNGKAVANVRSISFSFFNDGLPNPVSLGLAVGDGKEEPGTLHETTYYRLTCPAASSEASLAKQDTVPAEARSRNPQVRSALWAQI